jgi:hypothetical protein
MASDNLNQVGKYIRQAGRTADQALKRVRPTVPDRDRTKDTLSSAIPFKMSIISDGTKTVLMDVKFDKPPPTDCGSGCISTSCEQFTLNPGGHSITLTNPPFEPGTVIVFSNGSLLSPTQWFEDESNVGTVYVQTPIIALIVICYSYVTC